MTETTSLKRTSPPEDDCGPPEKLRLCTPPFTLATQAIITPQGWAKAILTITPLGGLLEGADSSTVVSSDAFKTGDGREWQILVLPFSGGNPQIGIFFHLLTPLEAEVRQTVNYTMEVFTHSSEAKLVRDLH